MINKEREGETLEINLFKNLYKRYAQLENF